MEVTSTSLGESCSQQWQQHQVEQQKRCPVTVLLWHTGNLPSPLFSNKHIIYLLPSIMQLAVTDKPL